MYKLWLTYKEYRSGGKICEGEEQSRWPTYEEEYIDFTPINLYLERPDQLFPHGLNKEEVKENFERGNDAYIVIVRYRNGNTFGSSSGNWQIIGVYKSADEANKIARSIEDDTWTGYKTWYGYFNNLESVDTHYMKVL